jgi:hypothetical protein
LAAGAPLLRLPRLACYNEEMEKNERVRIKAKREREQEMKVNQKGSRGKM